MEKIISCSNCTVSEVESKNIVHQCSICDSNYCIYCVKNVWHDSKWVKVCKACWAIDYLQKEGFKVISKEVND